MKKEKLFSILLAVMLLVISIPVKTQAATYYTVTFYTDPSMTTVHEVQQVERKGHPTVPATNPASYQQNGFRYEFGAWYWLMDNSAVEFSFTDDMFKIWDDTDIFAGYVQFIAEGYEMIVVYPNGTDFVEDTQTPVTQILKRYSGVTSAYVQPKQDYQTGTGSDKPVSATVNGTETLFASLSEAVSAADAESTVKLLADVQLESALTIQKKLTVDLNGCKLTGADVTIDAEVTVNGETTGSKLSNALTAKNALVLNGGDYTGMTVTVQNGSVTITGGTFSFDPSSFVNKKQFDVTAEGSVYQVTPHTHSFDTTHPAWDWFVKNGTMLAEVTYACACGEESSKTVTPQFSDFKGVRTYTAADEYGNTATTTKVLTYTVTFDGVAQGTSYHWGDICTLTADTYKAWYIDSVSEANKVGDGKQTHTFAVTDNTSIVTAPTDCTVPQAAVRATLTSTESGVAVFNAKWSLPSDATVESVKIYRGYTLDDVAVSKEKIITYGTVFIADLLKKNGDYTLYITNLTPTNYQHAAIVIAYTINGTQNTLVSAVQKVLPNGQSN